MLDNFNNIETLLSTAGAALGLLVTTITFFTKFICNAKAKKNALNIIKISEAVIPYIEEAEKFSNYSGAEKKTYVLTRANQFAIENCIKFDINAISDKIEELLILTKQVNNREKDKKMAAQNISFNQLNNVASNSNSSIYLNK